MNLVELMGVVTILGVTFGAVTFVVQRVGWLIGIVAIVVTPLVMLALYRLLYWAVGFLPRRLGGPPRSNRTGAATYKPSHRP